MKYSIVLSLFFLTGAIVCFSQTHQGLSLAKEEYNKQEYESCIKICDKYIYSNTVKNDPSIIEFYKYKSLSLCELKSIESIKEAIITLETGLASYEELDRDDATLVWLYRSFLNIAPTDYPSYNNHLVSLLCSKNSTIEDFQYYIDYMAYNYRLAGSEERKRILNQDEIKFRNVTTPYFKDYFLFVKGYMLGGDGAYWADEKYVEEAEQCVLSAYKNMQNFEMNNYLSKYFFDVIEELAEICEHKNKYTSSAYYREQQMDVAEKYWKYWKVSTPWTYLGPTSYMHSFQDLPILENYVNSLIEINDKQSILKAAKRVKNNPNWDLLNSKQKQYVLNLIDSY